MRHPAAYFGAGIGAGFFLAAVLFLMMPVSKALQTRLQIEFGKLLDIDRVHLTNGETLTGRIVYEDKGRLLFEVGKGTVEFGPGDTSVIERDIYSRYARELA